MVKRIGMIEFGAGTGKAQSYFTEPAEEGKWPGLIVIHEWWGLNDHIKDVADRFAGEGFVALAPDLYGGKATKDPEEAGHLMQGLDQNKAIEILNGAVDYLKSHDSVKPEAIGVTGFCMGGTFALLLACLNKSIKASAPFYGDVPSEDMLKGL